MKKPFTATILLLMPLMAWSESDIDLLIQDCERAIAGTVTKSLEKKLGYWIQSEKSCSVSEITLARSMIQEDILRWRNFRQLCLTTDDMSTLQSAHREIILSRQQTGQVLLDTFFDDAICPLDYSSSDPF